MWPNIQVFGVPKRKGREERTENKVEEITAKNFPNLLKTINPQIQESQ